MWDILFAVFFIVISVGGAIWVYIILKRRRQAEKNGDLDALAVVNIVTRNSGYCEQSTKNFTTVPFRVSTASSSPRSSKSSTLNRETIRNSAENEYKNEDKLLAIRRKSDHSWKSSPIEVEIKEDFPKYNEKAWI